MAVQITTLRLMIALGLVPMLSFLPNYYIEVFLTGKLWSAVCNCIHEDPNWALWVHLVLMVFWVNMLWVQLSGHPAGGIPISGGDNKAPLLSQNMSEEDKRLEAERIENSPSLLATWIGKGSLPEWIRENRFFPLRNLADLRRLHRWNGYAAYLILFTSTTVATFLWIFTHGKTIIKKDEKTGDGYVVWGLGNKSLEGEEEGVSVSGKKPAASTEIYTQMLWFFGNGQMGIGIAIAFYMRRLRELGTSRIINVSPQRTAGVDQSTSSVETSSNTNNIISRIISTITNFLTNLRCNTSESIQEKRARLLSLHKMFVFMGLLWITDAASHRIVFWSRIIILRYIYFPIADPEAYHAYISGETGNFELFKLWADPQGQYFILSVGKAWVNLSEFLIIGLYIIAKVAIDTASRQGSSSSSEESSSKRGKIADCLSCTTCGASDIFSSIIHEFRNFFNFECRCSCFSFHPLLVFNLFLCSFWFWANITESLYSKPELHNKLPP